MVGVPGLNTHEERDYPDKREPLPLTTVMVALAALGKRPAGLVSEDAIPPTREIIAAARRWLAGLSQTVSRVRLPWLDPHIGATPDGDVLFEWWNEERKLSIYVTGDTAEYIMTWKEAGTISQDDGDAQEADTQARLWSWLIG
jgi:hypothetical protein